MKVLPVKFRRRMSMWEERVEPGGSTVATQEINDTWWEAGFVGEGCEFGWL